jgi:hypothetical protein
MHNVWSDKASESARFFAYAAAAAAVAFAAGTMICNRFTAEGHRQLDGDRVRAAAVPIESVDGAVSQALHCGVPLLMSKPTLETTFTGETISCTTATQLHFWQWAFSDLRDDDIKGVFAEWMVLKLLGLQSPRRVSWADSDIVLPNHKTVEVKATAIWQSWKLVNLDGTPKCPTAAPCCDPARIRFGGLKARGDISQWDGDRVFKSHFYVFCFQREADHEKWNAWDLSQWEFYLTTQAELTARRTGRSLTLASLRKLGPEVGPLSAAAFQTVAKARMEL